MTTQPRESASATALAELAQTLGFGGLITGLDQKRKYETEFRGDFVGSALAVALPQSTAEVSDILRICSHRKVGVVPQGGNTGLVGGQIPDNSSRQILLSTEKLVTTDSVDPYTPCITVGAGVTLESVQAAASNAGFVFPLSLASEASCTIGGNLATNAGGTAVVKHGMTRSLCMGLEAVLADGSVVSNLSPLCKDNTGYDIRNLLIGSEGTLGVITKATLRLAYPPKSTVTAFVALPSVDQVMEFLLQAQRAAGGQVSAFELISRRALEVALRHGTHADPFTNAYAWYVLLEVASELTTSSLEATLERLIESSIALALIVDAVPAESAAMRAAFWGLRSDLSFFQKLDGASVNHDVSVPKREVPDFVQAVEREILTLLPDARPVVYGHAGDGNIHVNISQPEGWSAHKFLGYKSELNSIVYRETMVRNGSISAEHGIGQLKLQHLRSTKAPSALDAMRRIKTALDPTGIMNPGKLLVE